MASYYVTFAEDDNDGETANHFKTRATANDKLEEVRVTGRFARIVRWINNVPKEMARVNAARGRRAKH